MLEELLLFFIIISLMALLLYLNAKKKERFLDMPKSFDLYQKYGSRDFDDQMRIYQDTVGDISNLLHVYGCGINLGTSSNALDLLVRASAKGLYIEPFDINTTNFNDVTARVYRMLERFYDENGRSTIQGQVYLVVSQAPYYRDENNNPISLQFHADNYLYLPSNVMRQDRSVTNPPIQLYGYMIFTAYDTNRKLIRSIHKRRIAVMNIKQNFRQKENLCFMKCPQQMDMPCGCASQDTPYLSNCLESKMPTVMSPGQKYSYAILYRVNPRFTDLMGRNILAVDYRDYKWSPKTLNPIPTVYNPELPEGTELDSRYSGPGIVMYQNCGYKGWVSSFIPPGRYNMAQLRRYRVLGDVSSFKTYGNVKVKLFTSPNFTNPVNSRTADGYMRGNKPCFTDYMKLNDNLQSIIIVT